MTNRSIPTLVDKEFYDLLKEYKTKTNRSMRDISREFARDLKELRERGLIKIR